MNNRHSKFEIEDKAVRFLHNEMAEDERIAFEESYFEDIEIFEQIGVVESELIEKFVRGWMNAEESQRFEKGYLSTAAGRRKVDAKRAFLADIVPAEKKVLPGTWAFRVKRYPSGEMKNQS